jgi:hypothetical protein
LLNPKQIVGFDSAEFELTAFDQSRKLDLRFRPKAFPWQRVNDGRHFVERCICVRDAANNSIVGASRLRTASNGIQHRCLANVIDLAYDEPGVFPARA